jgi:hypothetical protein
MAINRFHVLLSDWRGGVEREACPLLPELFLEICSFLPIFKDI